jgi:hypothetical protein
METRQEPATKLGSSLGGISMIDELFVFKLKGGRKAVLSHLAENKRIQKLLEHNPPTEPYLEALTQYPHTTCVVSARVNGKRMHLIYDPTEHSYVISQNARANSLENTFSKIEAIVYEGKVYSMHTWRSRSPKELVLVDLPIKKILLDAFINNRSPRIEALLG